MSDKFLFYGSTDPDEPKVLGCFSRLTLKASSIWLTVARMKMDDDEQSSFLLPKSSRMILLESTRDRLLIRTRSDFSWINLITMVAIVVVFTGMEIFGHQKIEPGAIGFGSILFLTFLAFVAFQSTYQWLQVRDSRVEYQLRLLGRPLIRKTATLAEIQDIETGDVESESGGSSFAIIKTPRWEVKFGIGSETDSSAIDALVKELNRLRK